MAIRSAPMTLGGPPGLPQRRATAHPAAFEEIYQQWFASICTWIRAMGGPESDRDDVAQEVFLVVRRRLPAFDGANLPGWLYRITQRQVRDFRRRAWMRHVLPWRRLDDADRLAHAGPTPAAALEWKEDQRILHAMLGKIPESRRSAFILFEIEGLSGEEIAQLQGIPLNTVWTRLHHARRELFALAAKQHRALARAGQREQANPASDGRRRP